MVSGARKAAMPRDSFENLQRIERRETSHRDESSRDQKKSLRGCAALHAVTPIEPTGYAIRNARTRCAEQTRMHFAHDPAIDSRLNAPACTDSGQNLPSTAPEPSFPHTSPQPARAKQSWTLTPIRHWIGVPTDRSESAASATRQPAHEIPSCAPCAYFVCWGILANLECIHTQRITGERHARDQTG
jgi:hypothetical protein